MPSKAPSPKKASKRSKKSVTPQRAEAQSRGSQSWDDDDMLIGGSAGAAIHGRCGGRVLGSQLEQQVCDLLSGSGVTHSHSPRHFEVRIDEKEVAAYAPRIVLRGRGREGKSVVIETASEEMTAPYDKIAAFRRQYGAEFYVCFIAPEDVLDDVPMSAYDESSSTVDMHTLISRLAD